MAQQRTLILLKPDAVRRKLVGEIVARFERKDLSIAAMKLMTISPETAAKHYAEHHGKPFYDGLVAFMTASPVVAIALEGEEAVQVARKMMGATKFTAAEPGTIRGDLCLDATQNLVHGSDSPESAERELKLFFGDELDG